MKNLLFILFALLLSGIFAQQYPKCPKNAGLCPFDTWCLCYDGYWGDVSVEGIGECHECESNSYSLYSHQDIIARTFATVGGCNACKFGFYMKKGPVRIKGQERAAECAECPEKQTPFGQQTEVGIHNCQCKDPNAVKIDNVCQCKEGFYGTPSDVEYETTCIPQSDSTIPPNLRK